jgi:hypothetical protein
MLSLGELDAQIASLQKQLRTLRQQRNAFSGLYRLPAELVLRILAYSQRPHSHPDADCSSDWGVLDDSWVRLAMSCAHVWAIATQDRALWSFVQYDGNTNLNRNTEARVGRADGLPLRLRAIAEGLPARRTGGLNAWAASGLINASAAIIAPVAKGTKGLTALHAELRSPALPFLQVLDYRESGFVLDAQFLGGMNHVLESLRLDKPVLGDKLPVLTGLRELRLVGPSLQGGIKPVLRLIEHSDSLELLQLQDIRFRGNQIGNQQDTIPMTLPKFAVLQVNDTTDSITFLLHALPMPSRELQLEIRDEGYASIISLSSMRPSETLIVERIRAFWAAIPGSVGDLPPGLLQTEFDPSTMARPVHQLEFRWPRTPNNSTRLLFRARCAIQGPHSLLQAVDTLELRKTAAASWLSALPGLRSVIFKQVKGVASDWTAIEQSLCARVDVSGSEPLEFVQVVDCPVLPKQFVERLKASGAITRVSVMRSGRIVAGFE